MFEPSPEQNGNGSPTQNPPASISHAFNAVEDLAWSNSGTVGRSYADPQPSYNPTRATPPSRSRSPTRALSPPRSATPSRSSSRVPSHSHAPTSSAVIAPPVPISPLSVDTSHRYRTSSPAPRKARVRKGYRNRPGDSLTHDRKYFVLERDCIWSRQRVQLQRPGTYHCWPAGVTLGPRIEAKRHRGHFHPLATPYTPRPESAKRNLFSWSTRTR